MGAGMARGGRRDKGGLEEASVRPESSIVSLTPMASSGQAYIIVFCLQIGVPIGIEAVSHKTDDLSGVILSRKIARRYY